MLCPECRFESCRGNEVVGNSWHSDATPEKSVRQRTWSESTAQSVDAATCPSTYLIRSGQREAAR